MAQTLDKLFATIAARKGADPGTSYTSSMNLVVSLGVLRCGLTPAEAVQWPPDRAHPCRTRSARSASSR